MKFVSLEAMELIHQASLRILSERGVRVDDEIVRRKLAAAGACVEGEVARFPPDLVEGAVESCPDTVKFGRRRGEPQTVGPAGALHWPGNALYLVEGPQRRGLTRDDFARFTRVVDALEHVDAMVGLAISEIPAPLREFCTFRLMAEHTTKHLRPVITSGQGLEAILAMADVLAEGRDKAAGPLLSFGYSIVSPLRWTAPALALFRKTSGRRLPLMLNAEPMAGGTSPVTLAGSLAQANAETLSGLVIAQVLEPGRPCVHNVGFAHVLDMRTALALCGSPEVFLIGAAGAALARRYRLPSASWIGCEALTEDAQAGYEKMMGFLFHHVHGVNLIWGMGQLESQLSVSLEQLVIDDEIVGQVQRLDRGFETTAETLALEEILDQSPDFLASPHTRAWFRRELSESRLASRQRRERWLLAGGREARARAREIAAELARPREPVLPEDTRQELIRIEEEWRKLS
jgi:trimethylamine--corrinoid protein Co-methyltransferase